MKIERLCQEFGVECDANNSLAGIKEDIIASEKFQAIARRLHLSSRQSYHIVNQILDSDCPTALVERFIENYQQKYGYGDASRTFVGHSNGKEWQVREDVFLVDGTPIRVGFANPYPYGGPYGSGSRGGHYPDKMKSGDQSLFR